VLNHVLEAYDYDELALIGFSLGGNVVLKYLGEQTRQVNARLKAAAVLSAPCDLACSAGKMAEPQNALYMKRFMHELHKKIRLKMQLFPGKIDDRDFQRIRTFKEFDDRYTAPLHGFKSALDYWAKASSKPYLTDIAVPTLLVNALDDPFLTPACYPYHEALSNPCFFLETPGSGGHIGFVSFHPSGEYWSESRAIEFLSSYAP
jgi:uncharacterized protein